MYASDLIIILYAPIVSIALFIFPVNVRVQLAFNSGAASLSTAMTAPYVHSSAIHLLRNLFAYFFVVPLTYILCILGNKRHVFYYVLILSLLIIPALTAGLRAFVLGTGTAGGLSSIIFVFVGFLPLASASYIDTQFNWSLYNSGAPAVFVGGAGIATVVGVQTFPSVSYSQLIVPIGGISVINAALCGYLLSREGLQCRKKLAQIIQKPGHSELIALALILSLLLPISISMPGSGTTASGIAYPAHFVGYLLGYFAPHLTI
jgi:hypothetical protein